MQSVLPVNATIRLPLAAERMISAGSVSPDRSVIQWPCGRTSGTSAGTIGAVSEWPRLVASVKPPPSEPDLGSDFPPVQRMIRRAWIAPVSVATRKPSASRSTPVTRAGCTSAAPATRASRMSASSTVRAESVTGKSFPVSSRFISTPDSRKNCTVSSTENRLSTLRIAGGVLPA